VLHLTSTRRPLASTPLSSVLDSVCRVSKRTFTFLFLPMLGTILAAAACSTHTSGSGSPDAATAGMDAGTTPTKENDDSGASVTDASESEENLSVPSIDGSDAGGDRSSTTDAGGHGAIDLDTAAIYSIYPQIYSQAGTFAAVTADLGRIHGLGFDVLYLLPVTPIGQATGTRPSFGSPYSVHDYEAINPALGTKNDLIALITTAHALGMHVMLDEVLNDTSWDNALITQHPEYYLHSDGNPTNVSSIEQAFSYADVAQLDYKTAGNGLAAYITGMLSYWIETYDVDGFRFDTADDPYGAGRMIPGTFWQALRAELEALKPGFLMLGEELDPDLADMPFELDYGWDLQGVYGAGGLQQVATGGGNANLLQQAWTTQKTGYPTGMRHMTLLQDWDLDEDLKLYGGVPSTMVAATFAFTIDGVPLLFNGEEVGNDRSGVNTHTVIDWNNPNAATFTPFYKSLVGLRKGSTALQQGAVTWVTNTAGRGVVSYTRSDTTSTFLVILNFSNAAVTGAIAAPTNNRWVDVSPVGSPGGTNHVAPPTVSLAAYDFAVFREQ
jgi:cyclomaltodextrinase / maltogenic alpha-amylase / neopullulanase